MSVKCDRCGVETNLDATFFKAHKSFSRSIQTYCPTCRQKQQHSATKWSFLLILGLGLLGLWFLLSGAHVGIGWCLINLFFFQLFLVLTIVPHELGHAWMARLLGMRVFKIYIGSGETLFNFKLCGFESEFKSLPAGGLVVAAHRTIKNLRAKQFAFVLAGPAINILLVAAICPLLDSNWFWSIEPLGNGWQPGLTFFYANLLVLLNNLWPHDVNTLFGAIPSDGKQLLQAFFLSPEKRELRHAAGFVLEAAVLHEKGDYEGGRGWVEKGLALYPDNEALLSWYGVITLELGKYDQARECFIRLLNRKNRQPLMRPLMLNNIAYANALVGGDDLLKEADAFSQEAMAAMSWMPAIRGTRGTVLVAMGRFEEGLPLLHESMSEATSPNHKAKNACTIAEAECRRGNLSAARMYLEEARKLEPSCSLLDRVESILNREALVTRS
ncbi:MAG: site-2 protease family protein [Luteolibacter sp.]